MMKMKVMILVMLLVRSYGEEKDLENKKEVEELKNDLQAAGLALLSPEVSAAVEMAKKVKEIAYTSRSSSSMIGPRERGTGFKSLNIASVMEEGVYFTVDPVIEDYQSFLDRLPVASSLKQSGLKIMRHLLAGWVKQKMQKETMVTYQTLTGGKIQMHYFTFAMNAAKEWEVKTASLSGEFETMPDWYINTIQTSKRSFLKSSDSSRQEIVYVERGLTQGDIQDMMMIVIPQGPGWLEARQVLVDSIGNSNHLPSS